MSRASAQIARECEVAPDSIPPEGDPPAVFSLTVTRSGTGSGRVRGPGIDCPGDCSQDFTGPQQVTLTASPDEGSQFAGWSGDGTGTGSRIVVVDSPKAVTATFNAQALPYHVDNWPSTGWNLYSSSSVWNTPIDHESVAPNSDVMISNLLAGGSVSTSTNTNRVNWGTPIYFGRASDPLYTLSVSGPQDYSEDCDGRQIRCPDGAIASQATDGVMMVIDQVDGHLYHFQDATPNHTTRVISAGKAFRLPHDGDGFSTFPTFPPTGIQPIRPEELAAGEVNHAISMGVYCLSGTPVAPFDQSLTVGKNRCNDPNPQNRLSMGSVVFLDMTIAQIDALPIVTWKKAILKGLSNYGAVVGLNGGSAWAFKFECPLDRTVFGKPDPYGAAGLPSTLSFADSLDTVGGWAANLKVLAPFPRP